MYHKSEQARLDHHDSRLVIGEYHYQPMSGGDNWCVPTDKLKSGAYRGILYSAYTNRAIKSSLRNSNPPFIRVDANDVPDSVKAKIQAKL